MHPGRANWHVLAFDSVGCLGAFFWAGIKLLSVLVEIKGGPVFDVQFYFLIAGGLVGLSGGIISLRRPLIGGIILFSVGCAGLVAFTYPYVVTINGAVTQSISQAAFAFLLLIFLLWPGFFLAGGAYVLLTRVKHGPPGLETSVLPPIVARRTNIEESE